MWISEFADKKSANNEGRLYLHLDLLYLSLVIRQEKDFVWKEEKSLLKAKIAPLQWKGPKSNSSMSLEPIL
jgi:hypothetical protein